MTKEEQLKSRRGEINGESRAKDITKREHFAGLAMQGLLAKFGHTKFSKYDIQYRAVKAADKLLKELEQ